MADQVRAAFFRVEGTLVRRPSMAAAAYFTVNSRDVGRRVTALGGVALATGLKLTGQLGDQHVVQRMAWMGLRGMSDDRLAVLGHDYYESYIEPNLSAVGLELLREARSQGHRVVLLSDNLDVVVAPLVERLGADDLVCNGMEMRNHRATGRLREPVIGGHLGGQWARTFAEEHTIDLDRSCAYGAAGVDSYLLNAIGRPCAVNPDRRLRRIARDLDWPVVDR